MTTEPTDEPKDDAGDGSGDEPDDDAGDVPDDRRGVERPEDPSVATVADGPNDTVRRASKVDRPAQS